MPLGFWTRADMRSTAGEPGENGEFAFALDSRAAADRKHADWRDRGVMILQAPEEVDFGYTAVAVLPGPFRFRVFRITDDPT